VTLTFDLHDPQTQAVTYHIVLSGLQVVPAAAVPRAPTNLTTTTSATQVTFSWTPPAQGSQSDLPSYFLLEIGDAPGLTAFPAFRVPAHAGIASITLPRGGYTYRFRPGNRAGLGAVSSENSVGFAAGPNVPGPPAGLSLTLSTGGVVTATWAPPGFGAAPIAYVIEAGRAAGLSDLGRFVVPPTFSASGSLPPGTYAVRIRGMSAAGEGPASPDVFITVPNGSCEAPTAPTLAPFLRNGRFVMLPWTAPATGQAESYRLVAGSTPGNSDIAVVPLSSGTSFHLPAPPAGTYYVLVDAMSACAGPASSNVFAYVEPAPAAPGAPRGLTATTGPGRASLRWHPPVSGSKVESYVLEAGFSSGAADIVLPLSGNLPGIDVADVPGGTYFVRVRARNAQGTSPASSEVTLVIP
jgi:hypothetical protein